MELKQAIDERRGGRAARLLRRASKGLRAAGRAVPAGCMVFLSLAFLSGCASTNRCASDSTILALVNGDPVTEEDLKYTLTVAHRSEEKVAPGMIRMSTYVQKLIDDKLIMQEAYRMGIDRVADVQKALDAYLLRESVVRLHQEEVLRKVSVSEEELRAAYKKDYEQFVLGMIELGTEEEAKSVVEQLRGGGDFKELTKQYSTHAQTKDGSTVTLARRSLSAPLERAVAGLKAGEVSDAVKIDSKYYVLQLQEKREAPDDKFEENRPQLDKTMRKAREKERADEYLRLLRERAPLQIDRELFAAVPAEASGDELERLASDVRPIARLGDAVFTVADLTAMLKQRKTHDHGSKHPANPSDLEKMKENLLNNWIDFKLVDREALSRHYETLPDFKEMVDSYKSQLFKNVFVRNVLIPRVAVTESAVKDYYEKHPEKFLKPVRYRIQQITLKTQEDAEDAAKSLREGADFSWVARRKSGSPDGEAQGSEARWIARAGIPEPAQSAIDALKPGETSPVIKLGEDAYTIVLLRERTTSEPEEFPAVREAAQRLYFEDQVKTSLEAYIAELRKDAEIKTCDEVLEAFERQFSK